jgi:hypothetical protein
METLLATRAFSFFLFMGEVLLVVADMAFACSFEACFFATF